MSKYFNSVPKYTQGPSNQILTSGPTKAECFRGCEAIKPGHPWFDPKVLGKCGVIGNSPESIHCYSGMAQKYGDCKRSCK